MKIFNLIYKNINSSDNIDLYTHISPDLDAYGSQLAFYQFIKDNFLEKNVNLHGEIPYFNPLFNEYIPIYNKELICKFDSLKIVLDTANSERIGTIQNIDSVDIKIDHHVSEENYANLNLVNSSSPATCFILLEMFLYWSSKFNLLISKKVLELLYCGIVGDTGNFIYGDLNKNFFDKISYIYSRIDVKNINFLCFSKKMKYKKFECLLVNKIVVQGRFAYIETDSNFLKKNRIDNRYSSDIINIMNDIDNLKVWASFFINTEQKFIKCSIRSRNISLINIAKRYGGGGHINAVGAKIYHEEQLRELKNTLEYICNKRGSE